MNNKDVKDQLQSFGLIVRDEEFFKESDKIIKKKVLSSEEEE
jgi:hypothetical protein|tara:strand:+ start:3170 stop:3295 length:126 start_codon:yes stop_codon:yes gene_type:complete